MPAEAYIAHRTHGRMRLRIPVRKGDRTFFSALHEALARHPDVRRLEVNALTGSVVLYHHGEVDSMLAYAREHRLFNIIDGQGQVVEKAGAVTLQETLSGLYDRTNARLREFSDAALDVPTLAISALVLQAFVQLLRNPGVPLPWHTALWYALNLYLMTQIAKGAGKAE